MTVAVGNWGIDIDQLAFDAAQEPADIFGARLGPGAGKHEGVWTVKLYKLIFASLITAPFV